MARGRVSKKSKRASARFAVDARLPVLLAESFRSPEQAIRELVDNAWDADASFVEVTLPDPLSQEPIVVMDNGYGMREQDLRNEYLKIGRNRRILHGERTLGDRRVKGRKGIGKFSGLVLADQMRVETWCQGMHTTLGVSRRDIEDANLDLEEIDLPITSAPCAESLRGTKVTLSDFNQRLAFPDVTKFREALVVEYGRSDGFRISVNGERLGIEDIPGETFNETTELPKAGAVALSFTLCEGTKSPKTPGIAVRVGGRIVGKPSFFGLDEDPEVPAGLVKRIYGEVDADGLMDDVSGNWAGFFEGSLAHNELSEWIRPQLKDCLSQHYRREMSLQKARIQQEINRRLEQLPENRRGFAEKHLEKVMRRFWEEKIERVQVIVGLVLDAFEHDEYWTVVRQVEEARRGDVETLAQALEDFGVADLAIVGTQARARLEFLDRLEDLASNPATLEKQMHQAIEGNLWLLGPEYALVSSNKTLAKTLNDVLFSSAGGHTDDTATTRPDLLLADRFGHGHLLIEFKRPSHILKRDDENQAEKYRDKLIRKFRGIEILLIGREVPGELRERPAQGTRSMSYSELIGKARSAVNWLVHELKTSDTEPVPA